jgi:hypothetical protein
MYYIVKAIKHTKKTLKLLLFIIFYKCYNSGASMFSAIPD